MRCNLIITSELYDDNRQVTISVPFSCIGGPPKEGLFRQWQKADDAYNTIFEAIGDDPEKLKLVREQVQDATARKPWKSVVRDIDLTDNQLTALGFGTLLKLRGQFSISSSNGEVRADSSTISRSAGGLSAVAQSRTRR